MNPIPYRNNGLRLTPQQDAGLRTLRAKAVKEATPLPERKTVDPYRLTPRETDVAERVADGLEIKEIARELGIQYQTVKMHIRAAKGKMGVRNQIELALTMRGYTPRSLRSA